MAVDEITAELGATVDVGALADADRAALLAAIRAAREAQRAELQASIDEALQHVPRLLRGALRKVLFG